MSMSESNNPAEKVGEQRSAVSDEMRSDVNARVLKALAGLGDLEVDRTLANLALTLRASVVEARDTYLEAVVGNESPERRAELIQEVDRALRLGNMPPSTIAALLHDRLDAAASVVRGAATATADLTFLWDTFERHAAEVRLDLRSIDETQRDQEFDEFAREVAENVQAIGGALYGSARSAEPLAAAEQVLEAVRSAFGWDYATYWMVNKAGNGLDLHLTCGEPTPALRQALEGAAPQKGDDLFGRAWQRGDVTELMVAVESSRGSKISDLARAGARTVVSFPVTLGTDRVVGVVAFLLRTPLELSESRRDVLRNIAVLLSSALERMAQVREVSDLALSAQAVNQVLQRVTVAVTRTETARVALDAVRQAFDWDWGAYWARNEAGELVLTAESGSASDEFRRASQGYRYKEGIGVPGGAWQRRDLVVVPDFATAEGEPRAHLAKAEGLRSGVCLPLSSRGYVVGVIELWSRRQVTLSDARLEALRAAGSAASSNLERIEERDSFAASLREFANELLAVSSSLRATTAEQSASAQELASAIGQVTATLSELRETSSEALRNAESVIAKAEGALTISASGRGSVERAIESMRVIREQVGEIAERILQLNDQTSQIGSIIATVNEISAQSKLLALNAAIEAARAGEHGKGFGVVASEIRSLAEQSKEATGQVREILGEIQASTNAAVVAAEEGTKKSESGMALADTSGEKILDLARSMEESSSSARLIANSARQQSAGIEQVAQALVSISNATNDTASGLKQTEVATTQLVKLAERMVTIVRGVASATENRAENQNAAE